MADEHHGTKELASAIRAGAERRPEQIDGAPMRRLGFDAVVVVDPVALDRDRVFLGCVVGEDRTAAAARIVAEHIAGDPAGHVIERDPAAGELVVHAAVVVDVVVRHLEAL